MSKTVLVADESVTIRSVAESLLRAEAYSVRSAADGNMAMELARTEIPDLVLVGEQLPGLSGAEVCLALKADPLLQGVPVIFMRTDRPGSAPTEADEVLTKPFSPQSLLEMVHRFLAVDEATTAQPITPVNSAGVADELIDQALGIDDVGPSPALEMEVNRGGELADLDDERIGDPGSEEEVPAFGTLEEEKSGDIPTVESDALEFSTQIGLEDAPPPTARGGDADLDRALDMAFGGTPAATPGGPAATPAPAPIEEPPSSLEEISLGDPDPVPAPTPSSTDAPQTAPPAPASPLSLDDEPEPERPHDYDWFIKEMERESESAKDQKKNARVEERPRIEPVLPEPPVNAAGSGEQSPALGPPPGPGKKATTGEVIQAEEFQTSKRGYDEFISEFRKEIAKLEGALPPDETPEAKDITRHSSSGRISLSDTKPPSTASPPSPPPDQIREIADRLIDSVSQEMARELAAKIDPQTIYAMIEQKLSEQGKRES